MDELNSIEDLRRLKDVIKDPETQMKRFSKREWKTVGRLFYDKSIITTEVPLRTCLPEFQNLCS